jgi:hypothetical protein
MHGFEACRVEGWGWGHVRTSLPDVMRLYASTVMIAEMMRQHGVNMGASAFGNPDEVTIPRRVAPNMLIPDETQRDEG